MNWETLWIAADVLIKVTIILLIGGLFAAAMGGAAAARRHLVWLLTGGAALAMPVLCAALPAWRALPAWAGHGAARGSGTIAQAWQFEKDETGLASRHDGGAWREERLVRPVLVSDIAPSRNTSAKSPPAVRAEAIAAAESVLPHRAKLSLATGLLLAWSAGCALLLARLLVSWLLLRRLWRSASLVQAGPIGDLLTDAKADLKLHRHVEVRTSSRHAMPMTWGIVRPVILLPAAAPHWSTGRIRLALLHELAHIKRLDSLAQLVGQLCCAIYWFHPLAWLPAAGLRREQERAADDRVLSIDSHDTDYASFLLELARQPARFWGGNTAIAMARPSAMEGRLRAILDVGRQKGSLSVRAGWIAAVVAFALILPVAAIRGQAQAPQPTSAPATQPAASGAWYTGHVLSPDGKPVAGAEVRLHDYGDDSPVNVLANVRTDAQGAFDLPASPPAANHGLPWIQAWAPGFAPTAMRIGERHDNLLQLMAVSSLRLTLVGPDGSPAAGVKVRPERSLKNNIAGISTHLFPQQVYYSPSLSDRFTRMTDANGAVIFDMLPQVSLTSFQIDDDRFAQLQTMPHIQTGTGSQSEPATIRLNLGGGISGRITYRTNGLPAVGIQVTASDRKTNAYFGSSPKIVTNERGEYHISRVGTGNYFIRTSGHGDDWPAAFLKDVAVSAGQVVSNQNIELVRGTVVHGRVYEADTGKPFANAHVGDVDLDVHENPTGAITDAEGRFVMRVPPGRQGIYLAQQPPDGYSSEEFDGSGHLLRNANGTLSGGYGPPQTYEITATDGGEISIEFKLLPKPGKSVTGHVIDADGKPVPKVSVRVIAPDEDQSLGSGRYIQADSDGRFNLRAIVAGTKLTVTTDKAGTLTPVKVDGGEADLIIRLARNIRTSVSGIILDAAGQPIADAGIYVTAMWEKFGTGGMGPATLTDSAGHFILPDLLAGPKYTVQISATGYVSRYVEFNFTPGDEQSDAGKIVMQTLASGK